MLSFQRLDVYQRSIQFLKIARGEAMECAPSLDVLKLRHLVEQPRYDRGIELLEAVVAMLTKMISVDSSTCFDTGGAHVHGAVKGNDHVNATGHPLCSAVLGPSR